MEIVINISEEDYNALYKFFHEYEYSHTLGIDGRMYCAIANGVILPKGHGRLIDADAYINKQEECGWLDDIPVSEFNRITQTIIDKSE